MKTVYQITTKEIGVIMLRRRKIAKAFRWWLRENGFECKSSHCIKYIDEPVHGRKVFADKELIIFEYKQPEQAGDKNDNILSHVQNIELNKN